jgi:tRNA nucleotidyltransferase (CCA-adding enzyme)
MINQAIIDLNKIFESAGFSMRIVGGAVRDDLIGIEPKDIDFCSDARPDEMIEIFKANDIRFIETGLQHGTITAVLNGIPYEITSLRIDSDHDGRHATVEFTRDWIADLGRRDLTINAMARTFDGQLVDPFGGEADLRAGIVRFVGNPQDRMNEDFLRILRWLRFHARFSPSKPLHEDTVSAASTVGKGLVNISRERVWSEMAKLASSDFNICWNGLFEMGLNEFIDLPHGNINTMLEVAQFTKNPVTRMVAFLENPELVEKLATDWKWSAAERDMGIFLATSKKDLKEMLALRSHSREWIVELAALRRSFGEDIDIDFFKTWDPPVFPVTGKDLISIGFKPGKGMGVALKSMQSAWVSSEFSATADELVATVSQVCAPSQT